jgi:hypothetical protein
MERVEEYMAQIKSEHSALMTRHTMCQKLDAYSRRMAGLAEAAGDPATAQQWISRSQQLESKMSAYRQQMDILAERHRISEEWRNTQSSRQGSPATPSLAPGVAPPPGTGRVATPTPSRGGYSAPNRQTVNVTPRPPGRGSGRPPERTTVAPPSKPPAAGTKGGSGTGLLNVWTPPVKSPQKPPK